MLIIQMISIIFNVTILKFLIIFVSYFSDYNVLSLTLYYYTALVQDQEKP